MSPYETIKQSILRGDLAPGQPLVELSLAAMCRVSRTPIREALTRLQQDGLVKRTERGLVVRERSPEEILDIYETRVVLEATASRVASERRSERDVHILRRLLQLGDEVDASDPAHIVEANQKFHSAVWHASHNESLRDLLERLNLHLTRYRDTTLTYPGRWDSARQQHAALVDAIEARDGTAAYAVALDHFTEARDIRLKQFDAELF